MGPMRVSALVLSIMLASGCHIGPRVSRPETGPRDPYLITASELDASPRANLYDAVRELRPTWFTRPARARTGELVVYLEDRILGNARTLSRFHIDAVAEVRYLSPTEAQVRYGQLNGGRAAIVVELARD